MQNHCYLSPVTVTTITSAEYVSSYLILSVSTPPTCVPWGTLLTNRGMCEITLLLYEVPGPPCEVPQRSNCPFPHWDALSWEEIWLRDLPRQEFVNAGKTPVGYPTWAQGLPWPPIFRCRLCPKLLECGNLLATWTDADPGMQSADALLRFGLLCLLGQHHCLSSLRVGTTSECL